MNIKNFKFKKFEISISSEYGGLNLYSLVSNNVLNYFDLFGLIFDITYVRFDSFTGHAWIRTGNMINVTINAGPQATVQIAGKNIG